MSTHDYKNLIPCAISYYMHNTLNIRFNSSSFSKFDLIYITKHGLTHTNVKSSLKRTFILLSPPARKKFQVDFIFKKEMDHFQISVQHKIIIIHLTMYSVQFIVIQSLNDKFKE